MPIFLPQPAHNPKGPDGHGWNRFTVNTLSLDECALRPTSLSTFLDAMDTRKVKYGAYRNCINNGNCESCPIFNARTEWHWLSSTMLVREDDKGQPWLMNKAEKGWEEFGKLITWQSLLTLEGVNFKPYRDEYGRGIQVVKVNKE